MAQINYVSRNQLHCMYSKFEFWLDVSKGKTLLGFVNKLFISVQLIVFLDHVLLLAALAQKFKLLQNRCMAKWFYETELWGIYLYVYDVLSKLLLYNLDLSFLHLIERRFTFCWSHSIKVWDSDRIQIGDLSVMDLTCISDWN